MFRTYLANSLLSKKFLQLNPTPWLITNTAMKRNIEPPRVRVRDEHLDPDKITFTVSCVSCLGDVTDGRTNVESLCWLEIHRENYYRVNISTHWNKFLFPHFKYWHNLC